jgi:hypothetical protein
MGTPATGDQEILLGLLKYRVLTSGQLARLTGRSPAVIRRRLRSYLIPDLGVVMALEGGSAVDQKAYALSPKGFDLMATELGLDPSRLPFSRKPPCGPASPFFRHLKLSNDVAIAFSQACAKPGSPVEMLLLCPEWEMDPDPKRRRSKNPAERFAICESLPDLDHSDRTHVLRPDLVLVLAPRRDPESRVAVYLEADRATVSVSGVITQKLLAYWHLYLRRGFDKRCDAVTMRVLFVVGSTRTEQRVQSIQRALGEFCQRHEARHELYRVQYRQALEQRGDVKAKADFPPISAFAACFRFARWEDLAEVDILSAPVWQDAAGQRLPFFRGYGAKDQASADLSTTA